MSDSVEKLSGKLGIDTTDFKTALGAANRELRVLESSFKAGAAALGDWTKDAAGLESRMKTLTSQIDIQKLKVNALQEEHQRLVDANGANSRAAQDAEIKLNKETETLNKMERELGNTSASLDELRSGSDTTGESVEDLGNKTEDAGGKVEVFKTVLGGIEGIVRTAMGVVLGLAAAVVAVGSAIFGMVLNVAGASADLVDLSAKTGISVEQLQEMAYIGDQVGTSLDTITSAHAKLVRSMASGRDGTSAQADAFKALGVDIVDSSGNLRDTQAVFDDVIDKLGGIENPAERDALAMEIFGKSAQELNPLIAAGSDELARLADKAHEVGAVMSDENVAAFEAFDDTLASLQAGFKGTIGTLLAVFLPGFQSLFDQVGGYLLQFKDIVAGADGDFGKMATGLTGLITQIAEDVAQQAPQMLQAGLSIVQSILDAVTGALPQMLDAAIAILTSLIDFLVANLPVLLDAGVQILLTLVTALVQNLPMLIDAAVQAVIALATGLAAALPELIPAIVQAIITIVDTLIANLPMLIEAATMLILGLAEGLIIALPNLIAAIPRLVEALNNALLKSLPQFAASAGKLVGMLAYGILANLPVVVAGIGQLIAVLLSNLARLPVLVVDIGKNIIAGLVEGLESAQGWLYDSITGIVEGMLDSISDILGIASPSKKGRSFGANFVSSMALGGLDVLRDVESAFAAMTGRLSAAAVNGMGSQSSGGYTSIQNTDSFQFFSPVFVQGNTPPGSLGAQLKTKRV